jgi:hypothetical protein
VHYPKKIKKLNKIEIKIKIKREIPSNQVVLQTTRKMNRTASVSRTAFTVAARQTTGTHTERVLLFAHGTAVEWINQMNAFN